MKSRTVTVVAVVFLLLVALVAGGAWALQRQWYQDSYSSEYRYDVRVGPNYQTDRIENVTVRLPLPTESGEVAVATDIATGDNRFPEGWTVAVVDTERGPMLELTADEVPGEPTYYRAVIEDDRLVRWDQIAESEYDPGDNDSIRIEHDDIELGTSQRATETIDTRDPVGNEPLLSPRESQREVDCGEFYREDDDDVTCYAYDSPVYLSYDADPGTEVYVRAELWATNSWWVLGWNGNEYRDTVTLLVDESPDGWVDADGELVTGQGNYR